MSTLSFYATTFNCGRTPLSTDFFAANLFDALTTNLPPDLVVLSLQELAPLGNSFLGGSLLAPHFARFGDAVRIAAQGKFGAEVEYETVVVRNVGLTGLMVFARSELAQKIAWMRTAGIGVGVWEMGNKGAVGARIAVAAEDDEDEEVILTFVAAHFAPMEDACERRNQDWRDICENLVFEADEKTDIPADPKEAGEEGAPLLSSQSADDSKRAQQQNQHTLFSPSTHLFFLGDLNYRTSDTAPDDSSHQSWPQPDSSPESQHHYSHLLSHDQLTRERKANRTLHHLSESEIDFPPTYKYASAAQKHAAHIAFLRKQSGSTVSTDDSDHEVWLWAKHRTPSWCDRILYLPVSKPQVHAYTALPIQPTSDHRPVALSCSIPFAPVKSEVKPPFAVKPDWRDRRAAARRYELVVGMAAYLGWTWEGEALLLGTVVGVVGGWLMLRALVGSV